MKTAITKDKDNSTSRSSHCEPYVAMTVVRNEAVIL